jgi:hypothetical protein
MHVVSLFPLQTPRSERGLSNRRTNIRPAESTHIPHKERSQLNWLFRKRR